MLDTSKITVERIRGLDDTFMDKSSDEEISGKKSFEHIEAGQFETNSIESKNIVSECSTSNVYEQILIDLGSMSGDIILETNKSYTLVGLNTLNFILPTPHNGVNNSIRILYYQNSARTVVWGTNYFYNGKAPDMTSSGYYDIYFDYNPILKSWVCGAIIQKTV